MVKRVSLIGLGLIGGSLALAIKKEHKRCEIIGYDVDENAGKLAMSLQIIDRFVEDYKKEAEQADLIIIATPVQSAIEMINELLNVPLKKDAIVTDVGSTKQTIVSVGKKLLNKGVYFIGGHPMAGSHKTGITASQVRLFENAYYILTPTKDIPNSKVIQLLNWLRGTKAKFIELEPEEHDKFTGIVSHLPHIVASGLVHQTGKMGKEHPIISQLAAGGFRDTTRIASSSPTMWRDILLHNKEILLSMLDDWQELISEVKEMIHKEDSEGIYRFFHESKRLRD